jgi:FAD/FMN-containing dehydrogenase
VTVLDAAQSRLDRLPPLEGELLTDGPALDAAANDRGHIVRRRPIAVLRAASVDDVIRMVRYAGERGVRVAMRGQGHSHYGHAQVDDGLVIDTSMLASVRQPAGGFIDAGPGASWGAVTDVTLPHGLTPPVLPDVMMLTVGGTLSVGGLGATSQHHGAVVDNVEELDVITGGGHLITCSRARERELFEMTLAGVGQCGLIVRARLQLIPAPARVSLWELSYDDIDAFLRDHERLVRDGRFAHQYGWLQRREEGGWRGVIQAGLFDAQADTRLPSDGLRFASASPAASMTYREYLHRLTAFVDQASRRPDWLNPRPSVTLFLPAAVTRSFVGTVLQNEDDTSGIWRFDVCPLDTRRFSRPLLRMPAGEVAFSLWMFRTAPDGNPATVDRMLKTVDSLLERARETGGTPYAPYFPGTPDGWRGVVGEDVWARFKAAKQRFDPGGILTPGARIFA